MVYELTVPEKAADLFTGWEETLIWSCLEGIMGRVIVDDPEEPRSAAAVITRKKPANPAGDFTFFAGEPNEELAGYRAPGKSFMILTARDAAWDPVIEKVWGDRATRGERYAIRKEPDVFDREKLSRIVPLDGYELRLIDGQLYHQCLTEEWSRDLAAQFADYETFSRMALGVVALKDGKIAAGASTYSRYSGGIEIEIDTEVSHRRKGLALACGARLILECLDRDLYPSWDAQNLGSVALAEKLGYHFSHAYPIYEISEYGR